MTERLLDMDDFKNMSREELSARLSKPEHVDIRYKDICLSQDLPEYKGKGTNFETKLSYFGKEQCPDFASRLSAATIITLDDIEYLTDYKEYKTVINNITNRKDLKLGNYSAWINNYNFYIKTEQESYYLPIVRHLNNGTSTLREMLACELFESAHDRIMQIERLKSIAKNTYEAFNNEIKLGIYQKLSQSDKDEWNRIINNHQNPEYGNLKKIFYSNERLKLPYTIKCNGEEIVSTENITVNMLFAMHGLDRINYIKGKLYINGKETDKKQYAQFLK